MRNVYQTRFFRFGYLTPALLVCFFHLSAQYASAQLLLISSNTLQAASGETFILDIRCEQLPESHAAALVLSVSTPAVEIPDLQESAIYGVRPSLDVISATDHFQLRFAAAAGYGLTALQSRVELKIGDNTVPALIEAKELIYVAIEGGVTQADIGGVQILINESAQEDDDDTGGG